MARYPEHRFSVFSTLFRCADGTTRRAKVYCYEATNAMYDVVEIDGGFFVRTNMGQLSNMITDWTPAHYEIANRYNLTRN